MADVSVRLKGVRKTFGPLTAVDGIDLTVARGEFLTLLGPSGCGKTTTLNMIAGFVLPDSGAIYLADKPIDDLPPFRRDIGLVFQDYALFPHMTVEQNVAFGLRMRKVERSEITRRVKEALDLVKLPGLGDRRPLELSGGQRQRVALARALVIRPTVLLLDEPLSNLDLKLREEMRLEITSLQRRLGITTILVTHDQGEALVVSDRVAVMNKGQIEQIAPPVNIYERPASRFVADFIGTMNFVRGEAGADAADGASCPVKTAHGVILAAAPRKVSRGQPVLLAVRPERTRLSAHKPVEDGGLAIPSRVMQQVYLGARIELHLAVPPTGRCIVDIPNDGSQAPPAVGDEAHLVVASKDCCVFNDTSGIGPEASVFVQGEHPA